MLNSFLNFIHMGGYGFYIWLSYGLVFALLFLQWFYPFRKWRKYLNHHQASHE